MPNTPGSFIWYELMTTDATAAAKFYGAVVGWNIPNQADLQGPPGRDYRMIGRSDGGSAGGVLQITDEMRAHGANPVWLGYLHVKDVDATLKAILADGGTVHLPKMTLPAGTIAMAADPMGTPFYVMNPIPPPGKPDAVSDVFDTVAVQHVRWNELESPDLTRAKAFYAKHFGFEFMEVLDMGPTGDYCLFEHGGRQTGAIMQKPENNPISSWMFYFGVPSVAAAKRAIESGGGSIMLQPREVPGGEWIIVATDPQGAPFGVVGPMGE